MINPGTQPIDDATEQRAATVLDAFLEAVRIRAPELEQVPMRHRVAGINAEPVRTPDADNAGRFAWQLPISDGTSVQVLIPGVDLARVRDDLSAQAPCIFVAGIPAWWRDAVGSVASTGIEPASA